MIVYNIATVFYWLPGYDIVRLMVYNVNTYIGLIDELQKLITLVFIGLLKNDKMLCGSHIGPLDYYDPLSVQWIPTILYII